VKKNKPNFFNLIINLDITLFRQFTTNAFFGKPPYSSDADNTLFGNFIEKKPCFTWNTRKAIHPFSRPTGSGYQILYGNRPYLQPLTPI